MDSTGRISTWRQGRFIDSSNFDHMPDEWKERREAEEVHLVRPSPKGNAICWCAHPADAKWIADRLNLAAEFERANPVEGKLKDGVLTKGG